MVGVGKYSGELADFTYKGHDIRVTPKYYPDWKLEKIIFIEKNYDYKVFRCPLYVPKFPNGKKESFIYLIFYY